MLICAAFIFCSCLWLFQGTNWARGAVLVGSNLDGNKGLNHLFAPGIAARSFSGGTGGTNGVVAKQDLRLGCVLSDIPRSASDDAQLLFGDDTARAVFKLPAVTIASSNAQQTADSVVTSGVESVHLFPRAQVFAHRVWASIWGHGESSEQDPTQASAHPAIDGDPHISQSYPVASLLNRLTQSWNSAIAWLTGRRPPPLKPPPLNLVEVLPPIELDPIFLYSNTDLVSAFTADRGAWEPDQIQQMRLELRALGDDAVLFDMGANVGE